MAVRTEVVSFHSCDLCGQDRDEADLVRLYGPPQGGKGQQIDICQFASAGRLRVAGVWRRPGW